MKILYFSNDHAWEVFGTTRSLATEVETRGHEVTFCDQSRIKKIKKLVAKHNPDQVWLASSALTLPKGVALDVPVIGFGFSDPYYFTEERLDSYDAYVTNHHETFEQYRDMLPCFYNQTACDFRFHAQMGLPREIDSSLIGLAGHPRFDDKNYRKTTVDRLRTDGFSVQAYGPGWPKHPMNHGPIAGESFLCVINQSKIGLDLQYPFSPLAHRMLEYGACGTPTITRDRPEVFRMLEKDSEVLTYTDYDDLKGKLKYYLEHPAELEAIGRNAEARCRRDHDISRRVDALLPFVVDIGRRR